MNASANPEAERSVEQSFRSHPSVLFHIRRFVRDRGERAALDEETVTDLLLAVSEACANSMLHTASPLIHVTWREVGRCIHVEVRDGGVFRRRAPMPELEGRSGHGIPLMMALVDEMTIKEGTERHPGTMVRLVKCRGE